MTKQSNAWMPFYVGDYLRDTGHLTTIEHGAYMLLLMQAWTQEGVLQLCEVRLRVIAKMTKKEWAASREQLLSFFYRTEEGYRHKRIDKEINRLKGLTEQRKAAGKQSAKQRALQRAINETPNENSTTVGTVVSTEDQRKSNYPQPQPQPQPDKAKHYTPNSRERVRQTMPRLSDPPDCWAHLVDEWEVDRDMVNRPVVGGHYLDVICTMVCQAARINEVNWRGDWRPVIGWLRDGISGETILHAVRRVADRDSYEPPRSLAYFDQAVRQRAAA